jgi:hypothetical protein
VSVQFSAFIYEFGQNIVMNSQVKTFNVGLKRKTVHLGAGSGSHTLLFQMKFLNDTNQFST